MLEQEAQLRQQSMEDDSMWQGGAEEYTMEEMAYMRRSGMGRDMEKTRIPGAMYPGEGRAYMQDMRYHGGGSGSAYMGHMAADRDYSREVDEVISPPPFPEHLFRAVLPLTDDFWISR